MIPGVEREDNDVASSCGDTAWLKGQAVLSDGNRDVNGQGDDGQQSSKGQRGELHDFEM